MCKKVGQEAEIADSKKSTKSAKSNPAQKQGQGKAGAAKAPNNPVGGPKQQQAPRKDRRPSGSRGYPPTLGEFLDKAQKDRKVLPPASQLPPIPKVSAAAPRPGSGPPSGSAAKSGGSATKPKNKGVRRDKAEAKDVKPTILPDGSAVPPPSTSGAETTTDDDDVLEINADETLTGDELKDCLADEQTIEVDPNDFVRASDNNESVEEGVSTQPPKPSQTEEAGPEPMEAENGNDNAAAAGPAPSNSTSQQAANNNSNSGVSEVDNNMETEQQQEASRQPPAAAPSTVNPDLEALQKQHQQQQLLQQQQQQQQQDALRQQQQQAAADAAAREAKANLKAAGGVA